MFAKFLKAAVVGVAVWVVALQVASPVVASLACYWVMCKVMGF